MSDVILNEVRRGVYLDSVALMRLSRTVAGMPGVVEAALMIGTPSNKKIMQDAGILTQEGKDAQGSDLIIAIKAKDDGALQAAFKEALAQLDAPRKAVRGGAARNARTVRAAAKSLPDANLALISVPGDFAVAEARNAIASGLHVMIFSDNVAIEHELALKQEARARGRLVMGPDCGTAIINGVPLAFANRVPRGAIGIIGASGTGTQEVSCLIAQAGGGISQAVGVGGRDLKKEIGGISTLMAIDALDHDAETKHIVLISKPPHPDIAREVLARVGKSKKPFTICFLGAEGAELPANAKFAATLQAAAELALGGKRIGDGFAPALPAARKGKIIGLYSGGTLCAETQIILREGGRRIASNAPVQGTGPVAQAGGADTIIDLGADEYTQGRPHPMIDPSVRDDTLRQTLSDSSVAAILLDVVIGFGAHADPAGHVASIVASAPKSAPLLIASVTGTDEDPQGRARQMQTLRDAGIVVAPSNAWAARTALAFAR
ncbi:MAG: acyl-CoA synthetase FdrA [Variibacter sp.]